MASCSPAHDSVLVRLGKSLVLGLRLVRVVDNDVFTLCRRAVGSLPRRPWGNF